MTLELWPQDLAQTSLKIRPSIPEMSSAEQPQGSCTGQAPGHMAERRWGCTCPEAMLALRGQRASRRSRTTCSISPCRLPSPMSHSSWDEKVGGGEERGQGVTQEPRRGGNSRAPDTVSLHPGDGCIAVTCLSSESCIDRGGRGPGAAHVCFLTGQHRPGSRSELSAWPFVLLAPAIAAPVVCLGPSSPSGENDSQH